MSLKEIICQTLYILGHKIVLLAKNTLKLFCYFRLQNWQDAAFLGGPSNAIKAVKEQLGDAGASIDVEEALKAINPEVEARIPQLSRLKQCDNVALTEITETHPIDQVTFSIGIPVPDNNILGATKIDGIGFRIAATRINGSG